MTHRRRRAEETYDAYAAYRRPQAAPETEETPAWDIPEETPPQRSWDENTVWDDEPVTPQYDNDDYFVPEKETQQILATNRAIRLSCTLAALSGLFALFLCFAEKESRAIRRFSVQSVALSAANILTAAVMALVSLSLGTIPLMGFVITLMCWLIYIGLFVVMAVIRVRLMLFAWRGVSFRLPLLNGFLERRFL